MKKRHSFINLALLLEELLCALTLSVGVWGVARRSLLIFSIALVACSFAVAIVLFVCQYHRVIVSEDGVSIFYFGTTLFSRISDIDKVKATYLWRVRLPFSVYYSFSLGLLSGKRRSFVDGEVLRSTRLKLALLSYGVRIEDERDKTLHTPAVATVDITRQEHKLRDKAIKQLGIQKDAFRYRARGVLLTSRPHTSYEYGYIDGSRFVSLFEVTKRGKKYSSLDVSKLD
jgi:hypothetical protein